ncbi:MAG TPA: MtrB/PioB family outer membrane beta-barrel protein [Thermoanaerobaculia bacterium]|jgi:MtrB/PioB family decaheme-associated outer membrane protein|nr:MtrB/PioB family outer membrane beta-barrel protein [Thermoanaerobaculia bacterium]
MSINRTTGKKTGKWLALTALAVSTLLLAALPVAAQEPAEDTSASAPQGFTFTIDPIVFGIFESTVDTDSAKWEEYRDMSSGFVIPLLNIEGRDPNDDRYLDFHATKVRRDDARYTFGYGVLDRWGLMVDYNKIPHRFGNNGRMLFTQTSPGVYQIADPVQLALQTALEKQFAANRALITFPFLNGLISPYLQTASFVDLGLERDRLNANLGFGSLRGFSWGLDYKHEDRDGNRPYGASFGFSNATEIPEVIDYSIDDAELAGAWNTDRAGVRFGYRMSTFKNNVSTMYWDNPWRLTGATDPSAYSAPGSGTIGGSGVGFADLWADNESNVIFADGRTRLGSSWYAQGSLSYNTMTQDDPLLPYTLNASIKGIGFDHSVFDATDVTKLPVRNADNEVNVTNLSAQAGGDLGQNFDLTFRYRMYDYDNSSKRIEFPGYVRYHAVWEEIARITVPFSYTKTDLGAELGWDIGKVSRLALSYNLQSWDREFREIDSSDEDIVKLAFDTHPSQRFNLRASYEFGDRSIGDYHPEAAENSFVEPEGVTNLPGLRKYDEAAREYDQFNVNGQLFATDALNFFVGVTGRNEDYKKSEFGLVSDDVLQYNAEVAYAPSDAINFYLFGHRFDRESLQHNRQSGATPSTSPLDNWDLTLDETTDTFGLGFTTKVKAWTTDLQANYSKTDGNADFFSPPGGTPDVAVDFGDYEDVELLAVLARIDYQLNPRAKAGVGYRWEDYTIDSFLFRGLRNYLPGALLLNANSGDYTGSAFLLDLSLNF